MRFRYLVPLLLVVASCAPEGEINPSSQCIDLKVQNAKAAVSGLLTQQVFAGPPNFQSIAKGDAEELALILEMPQRLCADDGEFIDGSKSFDRIQVSSDDPALINVLNAAVGRQIKVEGEAFGAHTGHHHAPLVLLAEKITVM